ncbi:hypothetical protein EQK42_29440 [Streptomyces albidoflavus]|uniref:hypothetical protein n=1 Tax=Streptomyces albidoflavus TaxID=1886 RepID=UPI000FF55B41|nr:hypothetical protein [Streptomyces albidoflavus]RWZ72502.1 hypothetical protein EQK42_29440 [Streptomyces albidoflavus]
MSTTRHLINSRRRRQARDPQPPAATPRTGLALLPPEPADTAEEPENAPAPEPEAPEQEPATARRRRPSALAALCLLTLLLGGFAGWAHARAASLTGDPARQNTALTDLARTSEIKGQTGRAVAALFSYDHADPDAFDRAARTLLTGKAVDQHAALLGEVAERADEQKAVITTTVTDSAVERIDGDRARVLVYADQSSVSTAGGDRKKDEAQDEGVYAGAMFAVDVVLRDGRWLVSSLDTFGR